MTKPSKITFIGLTIYVDNFLWGDYKIMKRIGGIVYLHLRTVHKDLYPMHYDFNTQGYKHIHDIVADAVQIVYLVKSGEQTESLLQSIQKAF